MSTAERPAVGVDAGQSTIRVQVVGERTTRTIDGMGHLSSTVEFVDRLADALVDLDGVGRLVIGMTTLPADADDRAAIATGIRSRVDATDVWITGDEVAAHAGAFGGDAGVMLVVGTGVACIAADPATGTMATIDGTGFLIGDEGGGFWLGRHAVRAALAVADGRGPATALGDLVAARFGPLDGLAARVHAGPDPIDRIAHAALDVVTAASAGDAVASELLDTAAERLSQTIAAAAPRLDVRAPIALDGRLLSADSRLTARLVDRLRKELGPDRPIDHRPGSGLLGATGLATSRIDPEPYLRWITTSRVGDTTPAGESPSSIDSANAAGRYLDAAISVLGQVRDGELAALDAAADRLAGTIAGGGLVHVFGTGHSHLLAEEVFYRAGGLAAIDPILVPSLMLHESAIRSTELERTSGLADELLADAHVASGDTLVVASNSGGNAVTDELAERCRSAGASIVAIVSRRHAATKPAARLAQLADVVIDNHGVVGDAAIAVDGVEPRVGPTSTVAGAAIVQALVAATAQRLVARGVDPGVLRSANTPGGDAHNDRILAPFRHRIRAL